MAKRIIAKRPGQTLVADSAASTKQLSGDPTAKGWIIDDKTKVASVVGIPQAIKQGYWEEASGAAPSVTYPPIPANKSKP
jgi:hypothetical protein